MTKEDQIALLALHRDNLAKSATFEEYRDHHAAYVDLLIARLEAQEAERTACVKYVWREAGDAAPESET